MSSKPVCCANLTALMPSPLFKALSDPNRVAILAAMAVDGQPRTIGELAQQSPVDLSVVSRHLKQLREAGIVSCEKQGKEVRCRVRYDHLVTLLRDLANTIEACCPSGKEKHEHE